MEVFEKLKKHYLLFGRDDYINIFWIIDDVKEGFHLSDPKKIQSYVIDLIRYLIKTNLFKIEIGNEPDEAGEDKLSDEKLLAKIQTFLSEDWSLMMNSDRLWKINLSLTANGKQVAKAYLQKKIRLMEKSLVTTENTVRLKIVEDLVREEVQSSDVEEVQYETLVALRLLISDKLMEIGSLENDKFFSWNLGAYECTQRLKSMFNKGSSIESVWIRRTDLGNKLVEKWKIEGGELVKRWHDWLREDWG